MIKAVIIEDEGVAARRLKKMLENEGIQVTHALKSNKELSQFLAQANSPDLFFMDIHLNDGIVFETLQTTEVKTPIIFTTAYDEFAIRAFKQNSVDYLLKPIVPVELQKALIKFKQIFQKESTTIDIKALSQLIQSPHHTYRERIKVKIGDHLRIIKTDSIALVYSSKKTTSIQIENGRSYPIDQTLEQLFRELDPSQFYQVNRGQVVHIDFIKDVVAFSNSRLKISLSCATEAIIVSRERVKGFKEWLG